MKRQWRGLGTFKAAIAGLAKIEAEHPQQSFTKLEISPTYGSLIKGRGTHVPFTGRFFVYCNKDGPMDFSESFIKAVFALEEALNTAIYHMRQDPAHEPVTTPLGTDYPFEAYYYVPNSEAEEWIETVKGT